MATNKNEKMDAIIVTLGGIYPFFRRKSKSIKTCLFYVIYCIILEVS